MCFGQPLKILKDAAGGKDLKTYVQPIQDIGGQVGYGPPGKTEAWQPIDAGHVGAVVKSLAKQGLERWLQQPYKGKVHFDHEAKNWEVWEQNKFTMREKRILMTWLFGDAWAQIQLPKYALLRRRAFEKTGLLITKNGKNDGQVIAEGLKDFQPPLNPLSPRRFVF